MKSIALANRLTSFFPNSRFYRIKVFFYNSLAKFKISNNVRMFSSFNILGVKNILIGENTFIGHESLIMGASDSKVDIGKNVDIFRSYIVWSNIRSFVPSGSQITDVKFHISWLDNGSNSAQLEFHDFNFVL